MPTLEERLAYLEGRVEEHGRGMADLGDGFVRMDHRMDGLDQKIDRFRGELASRMDGLDQKIDRFREELANRMDGLDQKIDRFREELTSRIGTVERKLTDRIDGLDQKLSRQFLWLVGAQLTVLLAVIGALLGR